MSFKLFKIRSDEESDLGQTKSTNVNGSSNNEGITTLVFKKIIDRSNALGFVNNDAQKYKLLGEVSIPVETKRFESNEDYIDYGFNLTEHFAKANIPESSESFLQKFCSFIQALAALIELFLAENFGIYIDEEVSIEISFS